MSHHITIAKASFTAACLRPDVTQVSRDEISQFHSRFEAAVSRCTLSNIQTCKDWLLDNIAPSPPRVTALGKYLVACSKYARGDGTRTTRNSGETSTARKRLHILYLLNDVLHSVKYHGAGTASEIYLNRGLQPYIRELFQSAGSEHKKRVEERLNDLLDIWEQNQYFDVQVIAQIKRGVSENEDAGAVTNSQSNGAGSKEVPYVMPLTHGDPTMPYYDLPAANLMPHIIPNKPIPIRPDQIRALQLSTGPADEGLVNAVKDFLKDIDRTKNQYQSLDDEGIVVDMDELGQLSYRSETGEAVGDTYYGWSRGFCNRMKKRGSGGSKTGDRSRSQSYSSSRSSSRSRSPVKRRRYGGSRSSSPERQYQRHHNSSHGRTLADSQPNQTRDVPATTSHLPFNTTYPPLPLDANGVPLLPPRPPHYTGPWPPPPPPADFPGVPFSQQP